MKVKCINVGGCRQITQGRIYEVIEEDKLMYRIINDCNDFIRYQKLYFEVIKEEIMNTLIKDMEEQIVDMKSKMEEMTKTLEEAKQAEAKKLESKIWTPKHGNIYYNIDSQNAIDHSTNCDTAYDNNCINAHNAFKTRELAERKAFERQLMGDLEAFAQENNEKDVDWNDESYKYLIAYSELVKTLNINSVNYARHIGQTYFTSRGLAQKALKTYETELLRYFTTKE